MEGGGGDISGWRGLRGFWSEARLVPGMGKPRPPFLCHQVRGSAGPPAWRVAAGLREGEGPLQRTGFLFQKPLGGGGRTPLCETECFYGLVFPAWVLLPRAPQLCGHGASYSRAELALLGKLLGSCASDAALGPVRGRATLGGKLGPVTFTETEESSRTARSSGPLKNHAKLR